MKCIKLNNTKQYKLGPSSLWIILIHYVLNDSSLGGEDYIFLKKGIHYILLETFESNKFPYIFNNNLFPH